MNFLFVESFVVQGFKVYGSCMEPNLYTGERLLGNKLVYHLGGVQAFGAIVDEDAGYQAVRSHTKSWTEKDPSRRLIMMQSAPLVVPTRVNASLSRVVTA